MTQTRPSSAYRSNVAYGMRMRIMRDGITVLAAGFALGALLEVLATPTVLMSGQRVDRGPEALIGIALAVMVVLVALRHRFGWVAPLAALGAAGLASMAARAWIIDSSFFFLLGMLVCGLIGYMSTTTRRCVASMGVIWVVSAIAEWRRPVHSWQQLFFVGAFMSTAWGVGFLVRRPVVRAQTAEERAVQLEAEQAAAAERAAADERRRIARELHDIIAHSVSMMTVQAGAVRRLLQPEQEREREALTRIEETGRDAMAEMRRLVGMLKQDGEPSTLAPQPGLNSLSSLVSKVADAGLPVETRVVGDPRPLPAGIDLTAYRIVQEALTNALKYAGPAHACVELTWQPSELLIEVTNDGAHSEQHKASGYGQAGMRERLALYDGRLESGPRSGGGYVIRAHLPLDALLS